VSDEKEGIASAGHALMAGIERARTILRKIIHIEHAGTDFEKTQVKPLAERALGDLDLAVTNALKELET